MAFLADQMCFACGLENPIGLKLTFHQHEERYYTTFVAEVAHQGYQGIVHGGIMATILDEVMARLVWVHAGPAATARLEIRYRHPAPVGQTITVCGWITATRHGGRAFETAATATLEGGMVLAEATALVVCIAVPPRDVSA